MNPARIAEYEDHGLVDGVPPYLMWHPSPPDHLAFGQWSKDREHVAITLDDTPEGDIVWYAWRFARDSEDAVERLSEPARAPDEITAKIAAETWVRKNIPLVTRQAKRAIQAARRKAQKEAVKDGAAPKLPAYRAIMLALLAVSTLILLYLVALIVAPDRTILFTVVTVGVVGGAFWLIKRGVDELHDIAKKSRYIVKEIK